MTRTMASPGSRCVDGSPGRRGRMTPQRTVFILAALSIAGALGLGHLAAFVSNYHSIGVASYTTANGKTLSWGAFGMVFVAENSVTDKGK